MLRHVYQSRDLADVQPAVSPEMRQLENEVRLNRLATPDPQIIKQCQTAAVEGRLRVAPLDMYAVLISCGEARHRALASVCRIVNSNINMAEVRARQQAMYQVTMGRRRMMVGGPFPPRVDAETILAGPINWRYLPRRQDRSLIEAALKPPKPEIDAPSDSDMSLA